MKLPPGHHGRRAAESSASERALVTRSRSLNEPAKRPCEELVENFCARGVVEETTTALVKREQQQGETGAGVEPDALTTLQ